MRSGRALPLLGIVFTTFATMGIVVACGGDDKTVYIYVDAATPTDAARDVQVVIPGDDAGDDDTSTCQPGTAAQFTFQPSTRYQGKCQAADISAILDNCVFSTTATDADCQAAQEAASDCATCIFGTPQSPEPHPLLVYDNEVPLISTGACMTAYAGDGTNQTDCSYAYGEVEECAYESCIPNCLTATSDEYESCLSASLSSTCTTGVTVFTSSKCQAAYKSTEYGFCTNTTLPDGGAISDVDYYFQVVNLVCGMNPGGDAGVTDGGTDAGDAEAGTSGTPG